MRSRGAMARTLVLVTLWLAATGRPLALSDAGPHLHYGWGEPIRLRHLYATSAHGLSHCFLRIRTDGTVDCERSQSAHSLLEIRAVALRTVAIKGVHSVRYLCMGADGRMRGLLQYSEEDCAFEEEISSGYNVYRSRRYQLPVSLGSARQRQLQRSRGFMPLSHFLPVLPAASEEAAAPAEHPQADPFSPLETDSMDPFGMATKRGLVKSPSFQK